MKEELAKEKGLEAGLQARQELCPDCVSKLNARLKRWHFLRGPGFVMRIMDEVMCEECKGKVIQAGVRASKQ